MMFRKKVKKIHLIGIGGIGVSGLALILKSLGYEVSGSDLKENLTVMRLKEKGIKVFIGHSPSNICDADVVVYSSAVKLDNPEILAAKRKGLPVIPRSDLLADLMRFKEGIAIAGTHGKTTTSSMISTILYNAGLKPTILVGGKLEILNGDNALSGESEILIAEADESDGTFLKLSPTVSVITNIDQDHLDFYGSLENIKEAFIEFANRTSFYGKVIACADCPNVRSILPEVYKKFETYGISSSSDIYAEKIEPFGLGSMFKVFYKGKELGNVKISIPGKHNILNALASIAVSLEFGVPFKEIASSLESFRNANRRLELKGNLKEIIFLDDYAHHPTEIRNTIDAVRMSFPGRRLVVLFQPHRFSRTKFLWEDFVEVLSSIENLIVVDIYPASEFPIEGITAERLALESKAIYGGNLVQGVHKALEMLQPGDVFLSMGAGDVYKAFDIVKSKFLNSVTKLS